MTPATVASLSIAAALLAACAAAPFEYRSQNEIPPGPGMLTGEKGALVMRLNEAPATRGR